MWRVYQCVEQLCKRCLNIHAHALAGFPATLGPPHVRASFPSLICLTNAPREIRIIASPPDKTDRKSSALLSSDSIRPTQQRQVRLMRRAKDVCQTADIFHPTVTPHRSRPPRKRGTPML